MSRVDRLGLQRFLRWILTAVIAAALLPFFAVANEANASTTNQLLEYLQFSTSPTRSNPQVFHNATVNGDIYVFIDSRITNRIARVDFYIDQVFGVNVHGVDRTSTKAPFDLMGLAPGSSQAEAWDTKTLASGTHLLLANITWIDKSQELAGANFVVSTTPPSTTTTRPGTTTTTRPGTTTSTHPGTTTTTTTTTVPKKSDVFGMSMGAQYWGSKNMDRDAAGVAGLGATWMRTAFYWQSVEPSGPNQDNWKKGDSVVDAAQKNKVSLILQIAGMPQWASGGSSGAFPKDPKVYATFVAKVAAHYKGRVHVYELGNEPNHLKSFSNPDTKLYVDILKAAYPAIKGVDPSATVLTAGVGGTSTKQGQVPGDVFVQQLYANGGRNFFDGIAYHPYTYPETPSQEILRGDRGWSRMLNARQAMVDNGDSNKKIWITEFGAPTSGPGGVSPDQQAAMLQDAYTLWKSYSWTGPLCWFDYQDKGTNPGTNKDWFGLLTYSGARKPSAATYQRLATQ